MHCQKHTIFKCGFSDIYDDKSVCDCKIEAEVVAGDEIGGGNAADVV